MAVEIEQCDDCAETLRWWRHRPSSMDFEGVVDGARVLHEYAGKTPGGEPVFAVDQDGDRCGQPFSTHEDGWWVLHGENDEARRLFVAADFTNWPPYTVPEVLSNAQAWRAVREWLKQVHQRG